MNQTKINSLSNLQKIVNKSGLDTPKANIILDQFHEYFAMADEWKEKAQNIVVTDASQEVEMKMARSARLFLREKRLAIEKTRKSLKEQALREGKAIDGIANVLKALIVPIEEHLSAQENFIEIKAQEAAALEREKLEAEAEKKRIADEKARVVQEIKNKKEAEKLAKERKKLEAEKKVAAEKKKIIEDAAKLKVDRARAQKQKILDGARRKQEVAAEKLAAEKRKSAEIQKTARETQNALIMKHKDAAEKQRKLLAATVQCPKCNHKFIPKKGK